MWCFRCIMRLERPALLCLAAAWSWSWSWSWSPVISSAHMWTKLILTHHWPVTFCSVEHCRANFSYWTLHGLWPDKGIDCNSSWHFNSSLIEDLLPDMERSWPDLLQPSSARFWKYEWFKHGTCAAQASSLNTQHKYFSKALELYHKVDLDGTLKKFGIRPSEEQYSLSQIEGVIENFYGTTPKIQCVHPKDADRQVLGQIEICFSPDFTLLDCERRGTRGEPSEGGVKPLLSVGGASEFSVCDHDLPVYYPPVS
ncbi:ribonuclease T2 isoform X1 [Takifugu flavidus]|nr:ribonuclease T2 isoform X1 [Takifugu flavidus]